MVLPPGRTAVDAPSNRHRPCFGAIELAIGALKQEGFGVLTAIGVNASLKLRRALQSMESATVSHASP